MVGRDAKTLNILFSSLINPTVVGRGAEHHVSWLIHQRTNNGWSSRTYHVFDESIGLNPTMVGRGRTRIMTHKSKDQQWLVEPKQETSSTH